MSQVHSKIGLLMDMLDVTGKELAYAIGTDTTTVSKWRSGHRKLKYRSKYINHIAEFFLSDAFLYHRPKIAALLREDGSVCEVDPSDDKQMIEALSVWLTNESVEVIAKKNISTNYEIVPLEVYSGYEGWKKAIGNFWNSILHDEREAMPRGDVYIGDFGDVQWDLVEQNFIQEMVENIKKIVKLGHKVIIIDKMTDEYKPYVVILRWLPIYLSENVEVRYFQKDVEEFYNKGIYVFKDSVALVGMSIEKNSVESISMIHTDKRSVKFYLNTVRYIAGKSRKLIYTSELKDPMHMVKVMEENFKENRVTYMINHMPTFRNMPIDLLEDILKDNNVDDELKKLCVKANLKRKEIRDRCNYIQIYDLDTIEEAVRKDYIVDFELSRVIGREARIKKEFFRKHLLYLKEIKFTDTYQMVVTSFKDLNLNVDNSSISVQDDGIVIAWNPMYYDRAIYCKELTVVGGYFNYLKDIWNHIPLISKKEKWTKKRIMYLLDYGIDE